MGSDEKIEPAIQRISCVQVNPIHLLTAMRREVDLLVHFASLACLDAIKIPLDRRRLGKLLPIGKLEEVRAMSSGPQLQFCWIVGLHSTHASARYASLSWMAVLTLSKVYPASKAQSRRLRPS